MAENINVSIDELADAFRSLADQTRAASDRLSDMNPVERAQAEASREIAAALKAEKEARQLAKEALTTFTKTLLQGNGELSNYTKPLDMFGSAIQGVTAGLGPLGKAVGAVTSSFLDLSSAVLKQTDSLLKSSDQISKLGAANAFSTEAIYKMAAGAGLTSKELDKFTRPLASMQGGLARLGNTTADGVKVFGDMIAVTKETRQEFQRLGLNDEERNQAMANYVAMVEKTGGVLVGQQKSAKALQEASLEYTRNLYELSAITGKNLEESRQEQEVARATLQWKLQENKWAREYQEAQKRNDRDSMARIDKEKAAANKLVDDMMAVGGKSAAAAIQMQYLTGAVSKQSSQFAVMGYDAQKYIDQAKKGEYEAGTGADEFTKAQQDTIDRWGYITLAFSETAQKAINLDEERLSRQNKMIDREGAAAARKDTRDKLEANQASKGAVAEDNAQKVRNSLTEAERFAKQTIDGLVKSVNPLVSGFTLTTVAVGALAVAAMAAAKSLGAIGLGKLATRALNGAPGAAGRAGGTASRLLGGLGRLGAMGGAITSRVAGAVPMLGAAASVGTGAVHAYNKFGEAEAEEKEGKIGKEEAREKKGAAIGEGTGMAAGGGTGAMLLGAKGAAVGALVGPVGALVGGIIGASVGGWMGSKGGEMIGKVAGEGIAKLTSSADKKVEDVAKNTSAKEKVETQPQPQTVRKPELNGNISGFIAEDGTVVVVPDKRNADALKAAQEQAKKILDGMSLNVTPPAREPFKLTAPPSPENEPKRNPEFKKENTTKTSVAPKAAIGGVFEGPKSGYPVELHGKEAVVPLGTGVKTDSLRSLTDDDDGPMPHLDMEEESEDLDVFGKSVKDSDAVLKKLTATLIKLAEFEEDELDDKQINAYKLDKAEDKFSSVFSDAAIDISNLTSIFKPGGQSSGGIGSIISGLGQSIQARMGNIPTGAAVKPGSIGPSVDTSKMQQAFQSELSGLGITDKKSQANLMAQVKAESGFVPRSEELGRYSAKRLFEMYGPGNIGGNRVRFSSLDEAQTVVGQGPEAVGEVIYGGRMGNKEQGDGYKFRGRGLIQLTGRSNYEKYGKLLGIDLVKDPDLANDPAVAAKLAAVYFKEKQMRGVDLTDIAAVGKSVGYAGGARETEKRAQYARAFESELPQARNGGIFQGPESGYIVELHGNETVIPNDAIADVRKSEDWTKLMHSGIASNSEMGIATSDTEFSKLGALEPVADKLKEIMEDHSTTVVESIQLLRDELKNAVQQMTQNSSATGKARVEDQTTMLMANIAKSMTELVNKMSEGNDIQNKILQYSKI